MDGAELASYLGVRPFRYFPSVTSTNTLAEAWIQEQPDLPGGAVVIADEQTAGRGRMARQWLTPPGSAIAMSVILRPDHLPNQMVMAAGLAVASSLDALVGTAIVPPAGDPAGVTKVQLKWPNDVLIAGKKVCGILAEAFWDSDGGREAMRAVIMGIGVNVSVDFSDTPLAETATSITTHLAEGVTLSRPALIADILNRLDDWLQWDVHPGLRYISWKNRLVTLGQHITIQAGNDQQYAGQAIDVDKDGGLIVELTDGSLRRFMAGDVSVRPVG